MDEISTCVKWVQRGLIHGVPEKVTLTREELQEIISSRRARDDNSQNSDSTVDPEDEFDFAHYDDDDGTFNIESVALYTPSERDPYINIPGMDDEDTDDEDDIIKETDNLIVTGNGSMAPRQPGVLDVIVYNVEDEDVYPHHDVYLESCPFAVEVIPMDSAENTSVYVAAGQLNKTITIHDLHIMNAVAPVGVLGGDKEVESTASHSDAVVSLAWNSTYKHILASGSADKRLFLWDLESLSSSLTFEGFKDTVECIKWSVESPNTLLVCATSKHVNLVDGQSNQFTGSWKIKGEAVIAEWLPSNPRHFVVGTSAGTVHKFDLRAKDEIWGFQAHGASISGLTAVPGYCGLLITADSDGDFSMWNTSSTPQNIYNKQKQVSILSGFAMNPDFPHIGYMVGAGKKGKFNQNFNIKKCDPILKIWSQPS